MQNKFNIIKIIALLLNHATYDLNRPIFDYIRADPLTQLRRVFCPLDQMWRSTLKFIGLEHSAQAVLDQQLDSSSRPALDGLESQRPGHRMPCALHSSSAGYFVP